MRLPNVKDLPVTGKKVLLRTNYDVSLKKIQSSCLSGRQAKFKIQNWVVEDATRIEESLETIKYLLENGAKIIAISHLGRPGGKNIPELSLRPAAEKLKEILNIKYQISNIYIKNKKFLGFKLNENLFY